jgi:hypothetical protein
MKKSLTVVFIACLFWGTSLPAKDTEQKRVRRFLPKVQALRSIADEILGRVNMDQVLKDNQCWNKVLAYWLNFRKGGSHERKMDYRRGGTTGDDIFLHPWIPPYLNSAKAYAEIIELLSLPPLKGVNFDYSDDYINGTWGLELEKIALEFELLELKSALERHHPAETVRLLSRLYIKIATYQRTPVVVRKYLDRDFHTGQLTETGLKTFPYTEIPVKGKRFHAWGANGKEYEGTVNIANGGTIYYYTDNGADAEFSCNGEKGMDPCDIPIVIRGY